LRFRIGKDSVGLEVKRKKKERKSSKPDTPPFLLVIEAHDVVYTMLFEFLVENCTFYWMENCSTLNLMLINILFIVTFTRLSMIQSVSLSESKVMLKIKVQQHYLNLCLSFQVI